MRYCRFLTEQGPRYGEVGRLDGEDRIIRLLVSEAFERGRMEGGEMESIRLADAVLLAPVTPSKIVCVGRNYRDHAKELGNEVPSEMLIFLKPPSSIQHPMQAIKLPKESERVDYEGEVGVVIGRECRNLAVGADISKYIRGYTAANDVTARDLQKKDGQWTRAKGFDTFCPVGPVVSDELDVMGGVNLQTLVNGEMRQQGSTLDFLFPLDQILRYISGIMTLLPGDLVLTGTPAGVCPLKDGDLVEVAIAGLPPLRNPVTN